MLLTEVPFLGMMIFAIQNILHRKATTLTVPSNIKQYHGALICSQSTAHACMQHLLLMGSVLSDDIRPVCFGISLASSCRSFDLYQTHCQLISSVCLSSSTEFTFTPSFILMCDCCNTEGTCYDLPKDQTSLLEVFCSSSITFSCRKHQQVRNRFPLMSNKPTTQTISTCRWMWSCLGSNITLNASISNCFNALQNITIRDSFNNVYEGPQTWIHQSPVIITEQHL